MEIKLNLASKVYLNRQSVRLWLFVACSVLALALIWNIANAYSSYSRLQNLDDHFAELDRQAADVKGVPEGYTSERYASVKKDIALANKIVDSDQFRWTRLMNRFEVLVPAGVSLRTIQPDYENRSLRVGAVARNLSDMTEFMDNLLASDDFNQAFLQQHSRLDAEDNNREPLTDFSLVIRGAF